MELANYSFLIKSSLFGAHSSVGRSIAVPLLCIVCGLVL
jgi:hypothetical protein